MTTLFTFDGVSTLKSWLICMDAFWVTSPPASQQKKKKKTDFDRSELKLSGLLNAEFKFYMDSFILGMQMLPQSILVVFRGPAKCMWSVSLCLLLKSRLLKSVPWVSSSLLRLCVSSVHQPCWSHFVPPDPTALPTPDSAFLLPGPQAQNDCFKDNYLTIDAPHLKFPE